MALSEADVKKDIAYNRWAAQAAPSWASVSALYSAIIESAVTDYNAPIKLREYCKVDDRGKPVKKFLPDNLVERDRVSARVFLASEDLDNMLLHMNISVEYFKRKLYETGRANGLWKNKYTKRGGTK